VARSSLFITLAAALLVLSVSPGLADIVADTAEDVCPPDADPCLITEEVDVLDRSTLDFGTRTVRVQGEGRIDFGAGTATLRCGDFQADVDAGHAAILARLPDEVDSLGATVTLEARRLCQEGQQPCIEEADCHLGACSVRRCSLRASKTCLQDADCQLGTCIPAGQPNARRCTGHLPTRCASNSDCEIGVCPEVLTCEQLRGPRVPCGNDADCEFGTCSAGDGAIDMDGAIQGVADYPGAVTLRAAGDVVLRRQVDLSTTMSFNAAGQLVVASSFGEVSVQAPLVSEGYQGGDVTITAAGDITTDARISVVGGVGGAGFVTLTAGRDFTTRDDIVANGTVNGGWGGLIAIEAGNDVRIEGGSASDRTLIAANAADPADFEGDDGTAGDIRIEAARDVTIGAFGRIVVNGGVPGGFGGFIDVTAGRELVMAGSAASNAAGQGGEAGGLFLLGDSLHVTDTAVLDAEATSKATAGEIFVGANGHGYVDGRFSVSGQGDGGNELYACSLEIGASAVIETRSDDGDNLLEANHELRIHDGALVRSVHGGNYVETRSDALPLSIDGTVTPDPLVAIDDFSPACAPCGSGEDAQPCNDDVDCTIDLCGLDGCSAVPVHLACDDGSYCNGAETCHATSGCVAGDPVDCSAFDAPCTVGACDEATQQCVTTAVEAGTICDDANPCTTADVCLGDACAGTLDPTCSVCGNQTIDQGEDCDDGDAEFVPGDACTAGCIDVPCGFALGAGRAKPTAADALFVLRVAVGLGFCAATVCNVDGNGNLSAGDALYLLAYAVGRDVALQCPT